LASESQCEALAAPTFACHWCQGSCFKVDPDRVLLYCATLVLPWYITALFK